jgi:hypothetical protein
MKTPLLVLGSGLALVCAATLRADEPLPAPAPVVTVKEAMERTITPATNTLWGVPDAPTDEQWLELEEAAVTLLLAANAMAAGGTGPRDAEWAKQAAWQAFNRALLEAGSASLAAVRARDVEALRTAGDAVYTPCEGCHLVFNPGVTGEAASP